ncbi:type III-A CRISPR-associated RAMP protein Csm5 [uncultured Methanobrevibacter sp.]|uniref:type III-A CRISPR-associated RAMP protein Csm5 n=1 Tax=uncultured Methanobrevibacter sp. TaxID=253161 RepID=UPI0025E0A059|nr:type III-A CRISPR-associated RAMP protein Csm5 [uncultured Methanobrevibacter sp.]
MSDVYNCEAKVLSPIHIGSGEKYTASEYVQAKVKTKKGTILNTAKRIDVSRYYMDLDENKKDEFLRDLSNPNFDLGSFDKKISNNFMRYRVINKSKSEISPNQEITESIKTLDKSYVPGSSIKGAIKSAILYGLIDDDAVDTIEHKILRNNGRVQNREYTNFLSDIFSTRSIRNSAQADIMKFLQVTDSSTIKSPYIYDILTVMAAFRKGHHEYYSRNRNTRTPTLSFLETIPAGSKLTFDIINGYSKLVHKRNFENKKNLIDIDNIKKSIFIFSKSLINNELEFADDYGIDTLYKFYNKIEKINSIDNPLLKVGAGSGYLATTVNLKIKKYDSYLYNKIADGTRGKNYEYEFPKSRKITQNGGKPLGWIQLSFKES